MAGTLHKETERRTKEKTYRDTEKNGRRLYLYSVKVD